MESILSTAQKLHEDETRRFQERQRKREERKQISASRKQQVEREQAKIVELCRKRQTNSNQLYKLFSELQAVSHSNNLGLQCPEIVVVGMQSDGKSSFVEALLGFHFNIVSTNIGTRRPLILQMMNNMACKEPRCRFRMEDKEEFESYTTPVQSLSREIVRRTNEEVGNDKNIVSNKPIILRVEFERCANLTIYDTPGFRIGGDLDLSNKIKSMVLKLMSKPERLIVCLEQSTVEWANTISLEYCREVDPSLKRTIFVSTKFDNRIKELRTKDEGIVC